MKSQQDAFQRMNDSAQKMERIIPHSKAIHSLSSAQNKLNGVLNPIDKLPMMKVREEMTQKLGIMNPAEFLRPEKSRFQTMRESAERASTWHVYSDRSSYDELNQKLGIFDQLKLLRKENAVQMIRESAAAASKWYVDSGKLRDSISSAKLSDLIEESPIQKLLRNKTFKNEFLSVSSKIVNDIYNELGINDENDFETFKYRVYDAIESDKEIVEKVEEFIVKKATAKDEATIKTIEEGYYMWIYETFFQKKIPLQMLYWTILLFGCLDTYLSIHNLFFTEDRPEVHNHFYNNNYQINSESTPTQIKQLWELKETGAITDQEFEEKKKELLDNI